MKYVLTFLCLLICQTVSADMIINEVLSNEPASSTTLEWIELYNDSDSTKDLSEYTLIVDSDTTQLSSYEIPAHSYIVLCRKLYSFPPDISFESYWGNNSQVWGDSEFESSLLEPIELPMSLLNLNGEIKLLHFQDIVSTFSWSQSGIDGTSWERKFTDSNIILQSESNLLSTPGYINSVSLLPLDISVDSVSVELIDFVPYYKFNFTNRSTSSTANAILQILDSTHTMIHTAQIPTILPDSSLQIETLFSFQSNNFYQTFTAVVELTGDMRVSNDSLQFEGVSSQYPPLILSEFLANPEGKDSSEWIEVYNRSSEIIDISEWQIGDAISLYPMTQDPFYIHPNEYFIIVSDFDNFMEQNIFVSAIIIGNGNWGKLNDDGDIIRLADTLNIIADTYSYTKTYDQNYTIARNIPDNLSQWGRSAVPKGTPGHENNLFEYSNDDNLDIKLSSKYISPDNDGFEDTLSIQINVPLSESYSFKLYDINGTIVKTFYDDEKLIPQNISWNGLGDDNKKLPIGMYVLYLTTEHGKSRKETIVIAR